MATIGKTNKVSFCDKCRKLAKPAINLEEGVFCGQCVNKVLKKRKPISATPGAPLEQQVDALNADGTLVQPEQEVIRPEDIQTDIYNGSECDSNG